MIIAEILCKATRFFITVMKWIKLFQLGYEKISMLEMCVFYTQQVVPQKLCTDNEYDDVVVVLTAAMLVTPWFI